MNERATPRPAGLPPIWHLTAGWGLFIGPLTYNAPHAHSVPVLLAGVHGAFRLQLGDGRWRRCRTAVVPAGVSYALDVGGAPLGVLYLEPSRAGVGALAPLVHGGREEGGVLIAPRGEVATLCALYDAPESAHWTSEAVESLLGFAVPRAGRRLDPRIARAVAALAAAGEGALSAGEAARAVGLSSSRFQHLFAAEVGVPFRRYRVWQRLRGAIGAIVAGSSFTAAAHVAGFSDQAHFARAFRQAFGAPPSPSLRRVRAASRRP